jgi:hypothetical protein
MNVDSVMQETESQGILGHLMVTAADKEVFF